MERLSNFINFLLPAVTGLMAISLLLLHFKFPEHEDLKVIVFSTWALVAMIAMLFQAYMLAKARARLNRHRRELEQMKRWAQDEINKQTQNGGS